MLLNLLALLLIILNDRNVRRTAQLTSIPSIGICPLKCNCQKDFHAMACQNLTRVEVRQLFKSGGTFISQFASSLLNLSIVDSELDRMEIVPRMDNLLWLSLSGNQLERASFERPDSLEDSLRPAFPSLIFLDLSFNQIPSISRNAFLQFPNLEEIRLANNRIFSIEWEAFRLFKLKRLFLNDNYLLMISEHMLRYSPSIEELDLSRNQLSFAQSSSFFAAQRLKSLNLSHNRLQRFDYDSFSPLFQLESLDLAFNNFSAIPADIRQFVALRMLNFSGNPVEKLAEGELVQPMLQTFELASCPKLRLVEQRAFAMTPNLQFLIMANNPRLEFISPSAFPNNSLLFELNLRNNSLKSVDQRLMDQPTRIFLEENPLECECMAVEKYKEKIVDFNTSKCAGNAKIRHFADFDAPNGKCSAQPILPFGNSLRGQVGDFFSLYCAPRNGNGATDSVKWILPNGTEIHSVNGNGASGQIGIEKRAPLAPISTKKNITNIRVIPHGIFMAAPKVESAYLGGIYPTLAKQHLHYQRHSKPAQMGEATTTTMDGGNEMPQQMPRIQAVSEQLRFEVLMFEDAGEYICRLASGADARLKLVVERPNIEMKPIEIGSHYASLAWNDTLKIRAYERVQLSLQIRHAVSGQIGRIIQLSLHNPWHSYNVVRLRPLTNYTFCLVYSLRQPGGGNIETAKILYKTCADVMTEQQLGFWSSLSPTVIGVMLSFCFLLFSLLCFRTIYLRFYIWHEAKMRARMNQSMSGQSFLSHTSSLPQNHANGNGNEATIMSQSNTFDSCPGQILNQFGGKSTAQNGMGQKGKRKKNKCGAAKSLLMLESEKEDQTEDIALC